MGDKKTVVCEECAGSGMIEDDECSFCLGDGRVEVDDESTWEEDEDRKGDLTEEEDDEYDFLDEMDEEDDADAEDLPGDH